MRPRRSQAIVRFLLRPESLALGAVAVALLWVFWPTLAGVAERWGKDPQYSHGYLVPLFSLFLLGWWREEAASGTNSAPAGGGFLCWPRAWPCTRWHLLLLSLVRERGPVALCGRGRCSGGRPGLRCSGPGQRSPSSCSCCPCPFSLRSPCAAPSARCHRGQHLCLATLGLPAFAEGNIIRMGQVRIGVVEACAGLSMLLVFFALSTAVTLLNAPALARPSHDLPQRHPESR